MLVEAGTKRQSAGPDMVRNAGLDDASTGHVTGTVRVHCPSQSSELNVVTLEILHLIIITVRGGARGATSSAESIVFTAAGAAPEQSGRQVEGAAAFGSFHGLAIQISDTRLGIRGTDLGRIGHSDA